MRVSSISFQFDFRRRLELRPTLICQENHTVSRGISQMKATLHGVVLYKNCIPREEVILGVKSELASERAPATRAREGCYPIWLRILQRHAKSRAYCQLCTGSPTLQWRGLRGPHE